MSNPAAFYNRIYGGNSYATFFTESDHFAAPELRRFVAEFHLGSGRCLEVGGGRGAFQDIVQDYTGTDLSEVVAGNYRKPFFTANAEALPFDDGLFDAVWTITVLEHVTKPRKSAPRNSSGCEAEWAAVPKTRVELSSLDLRRNPGAALF